jgi:hypothetical protein
MYADLLGGGSDSRRTAAAGSDRCDLPARSFSGFSACADSTFVLFMF